METQQQVLTGTHAEVMRELSEEIGFRLYPGD